MAGSYLAHDLADATGPTLSELELLADVAEIRAELDVALSESAQLREALAAALSREMFLQQTIADLRAGAPVTMWARAA